MRCLLVEDERQVREGMVALVPWRELGFDEVLTASNGLEALESLASAPVDLIVSDVRMPRLSGVQLLEEIRRKGIDTPFLFISGFSDKEYLIAAIRYRAVDYLEKPVMIGELTERIRSIMTEVRATADHVTVHGLLSGKAAVPPVFAGACRFSVAILSLCKDGFRLTRQQIDGAIASLSGCVLREEEATGDMLLIVAERAEEKADFVQFIDSLNRAGGGYALYLSQSVSSAADLPKAYEQADVCASRAYFGMSRGLFVYEEPSDEQTGLPDRVREDMVTLQEKRLYALIPEAVAGWGRALSRMAGVRRADALAFYRAVSDALGGDGWQRIGECADFCCALPMLRELAVLRAKEMLANECNPVVARAMLYIGVHPDSSLSVGEIAKAAYVSSSHLSFLFKQETGVPIKQYVLELRIEAAKRLLREGEPVHTAAAKVGIRDVMYFSKLFKRETGVSPSAFR